MQVYDPDEYADEGMVYPLQDTPRARRWLIWAIVAGLIVLGFGARAVGAI